MERQGLSAHSCLTSHIHDSTAHLGCSTQPQEQCSELPLTCKSLGGTRILLRQVNSHAFPHDIVGTDPLAFVFATVDWSEQQCDQEFHHFNARFKAQIDMETLELCDAEESFHPFAFATKAQLEDFPSHHKILCMSGEEWCNGLKPQTLR